VSAVKAITSRDNPLLVRLRKLAGDPAAYRRLSEVWIEGDHLCAAFLQRGGVAAQAVITEPAWELSSLRDLASRAEMVAVIPQALMAGLSTLESPPPLAFALPWQGQGSLQANAPTVVLDRLQAQQRCGRPRYCVPAWGRTSG
jgi:TrmH family RNA methyltransferase